MTKYISEINFVSSAALGDIIEIGLIAVAFGRTSITMRANVRNIVTRNSILEVEKIVFVGLDNTGQPKAHGYTDITHARDRFPHPAVPDSPS